MQKDPCWQTRQCAKDNCLTNYIYSPFLGGLTGDLEHCANISHPVPAVEEAPTPGFFALVSLQALRGDTAENSLVS